MAFCKRLEAMIATAIFLTAVVRSADSETFNGQVLSLTRIALVHFKLAQAEGWISI